MKDKTFADYLIRHGVELPADTVVIKTTDKIPLIEWDDVKGMEKHNTYPIFSNIMLEMPAFDGGHNLILAIFNSDKSLRKQPLILFCFHIDVSGKIRIGDRVGNVWWYDCDTRPYVFYMHGQDNAYYDLFARSMTLAESQDDPLTEGIASVEFYHSIARLRVFRQSDDYRGRIWNSFLSVMSLFHKKTECELITHPRGVRRSVKRKTGKEPSPYFMLKVESGKTQKRYTPSGNKTGQKNAQHIVRGHFRHVVDHPLQQFNGTFWIPSHMRGDKAQGETLKGYTIVLPDNEV